MEWAQDNWAWILVTGYLWLRLWLLERSFRKYVATVTAPLSQMQRAVLALTQVHDDDLAHRQYIETDRENRSARDESIVRTARKDVTAFTRSFFGP